MAINWLAALVAAFAMFGLGAVWYSPMLFLNRWVIAAGLEVDYAKRGNFGAILATSFVLTLIMAVNLAFFVSDPSLGLGAVLGYSIAAGLGWAAVGLSIIALFERRPLAYFLINGGYLTVGFAVMGLILGLWR